MSYESSQLESFSDTAGIDLSSDEAGPKRAETLASRAMPLAAPSYQLEVLEEVRDELLDFQSCGTSIMETSHRGKQYDQVHEETIALVKELMGLGENFKVCFLQGGASLQFAMVPMNLMMTPARTNPGWRHWNNMNLYQVNMTGDESVIFTIIWLALDQLDG